MKKYWSLMGILLVSGVLVGCGDSSDPGPGTKASVDISGSWATDCFESDEPGVFVIQTLVISENQFQSQTRAYVGGGCDTELGGLWEHNYTMTIGASVATSNAGTANNVDLEFIDSFHTMKYQPVTDYWNAQPGGFCGKSDWILDEPFEVTNNVCDFEAASSGDILYDIVKLDIGVMPSTLQFGARTLDRNSRPQSLVTLLYKKL